jgi:proton-dependent oligopeptide transporter, POT family
MTTSTIALDKQPPGLYLLFFTELWERFGFYTLQTILILYMSKALFMTDMAANSLYAAFNSLLYLTPTIGGFIADRYLGFQRAIILGGNMLIAAYIITALPIQWCFFVGLSLLICANGFFKPNVSSIVGELYHANDARRDGGFTLFYMGINLGSLIPPLIAGYIVLHYGWTAGFLLAALGMLIGQLTFLLFRKGLQGAGAVPNRRPQYLPNWRFYTMLTLGIAGIMAICNVAFHYPHITNYLIEVSALIIFLITLLFISREQSTSRKRMLACLVLIIISIGFWSLYNQTFMSLMFFADRNMNKEILGIPLDAEATQFFNPFFIIVLSPILNRLWIKLDHYGLNPSVQVKFSLGVLFMCSGFLLLAIGATHYSNNGLTSAWWLSASYFLQTIGELLLSPIGLAMITVLCPKKLVGMMMGVWFFSQTASFAIADKLADLAAVPNHTSTIDSLAIYSHAFTVYAIISLIIALVSFALVPFLKRMINSQNVIIT